MVKTIVILEWLVVAFFALMAVTQIIIPVVTGRPMFPLLHRRGRELEAALAKSREDKDFDKIERQLPQQKKRGSR